MKTFCHLCHSPVHQGFFCSPCLEEIRAHQLCRERCSTCQGPRTSEEEICWRCRKESRPSFPVRGLYPYKSLGGELLRQFKFEKEKYLSTFLAQELYRLLPFNSWPLIPIGTTNPGHRIWEPVTEVLKELHRLSRREILQPVFPIRSQTQKSLKRDQRFNSEIQARWKETKIPRQAILFDDVLTTGATMKKIGAFLSSKGVKDLQGLCICLG